MPEQIEAKKGDFDFPRGIKISGSFRSNISTHSLPLQSLTEKIDVTSTEKTSQNINKLIEDITEEHVNDRRSTEFDQE